MAIYQTDPRAGNEEMMKLAKDALAAFRADAKKAYAELIKQYEGSTVVVGVFGIGSVSLSVEKGEVKLNPDAREVKEVRGRGAIYPETIVAISEGRLTVMEAFHQKGIVVHSGSENLHEAYESFCRHSEAALKSKRLQKTLKEFRAFADV